MSNAQKCLNKLRTELLGTNYYIVDPVGGNQANEIITEEIINQYKPNSHTFKNIVKKLVRY